MDDSGYLKLCSSIHVIKKLKYIQMKGLINLLSFVLVVVVFQSCNNVSNETNTKSDEAETVVNTEESNEVKAYYFHATRRCATCEAVEGVTKEALTEYYGDKIVFESINRDEEKDNPLLKKYEIGGQTLLFVKGDKVIDLTTDAFMNARSNPDKFKAKIKETLDPIL